MEPATKPEASVQLGNLMTPIITVFVTKENWVFNKISDVCSNETKQTLGQFPALFVAAGPTWFFFQRDIGTFAAVFVATKPDIFSQILEQFSAIIVAAKCFSMRHPDISSHVCGENPDFFLSICWVISSCGSSNKMGYLKREQDLFLTLTNWPLSLNLT